MGSKVKCQHCWKVFEVPDESLNQERRCSFCQRITSTVPIKEDTKKQTTKIAAERQKPKNDLLVLQICVAILSFFTLLNIVLVFGKNSQIKKYQAEIKSSQSSPEWEEQLEERLGKLEQQLREVGQSLDKNHSQIIPPQSFATSMLDSVGESIKTMNAQTKKHRKNLAKITVQLKKMQQDLAKIKKQIQKKKK